MTSPRHAAVLGGNRIPFARANGPYATESNQAMLTAAIDGLVARFSLQDEQVEEVVAGAVLKHARDFNLTREAVLGSQLASTSPAYDIQQACDTGLEAAVLVANKIALGQIDVGIAGGTDTASEWKVSREAQDELAATSHQRLAAAYDRGFFDDLVTPYAGLERDQNLRRDSSVEKLAKLKPVFGEGEDATMTAGNSTPLSDGAAVVLLARGEGGAPA